MPNLPVTHFYSSYISFKKPKKMSESHNLWGFTSKSSSGPVQNHHHSPCKFVGLTRLAQFSSEITISLDYDFSEGTNQNQTPIEQSRLREHLTNTSSRNKDSYKIKRGTKSVGICLKPQALKPFSNTTASEIWPLDHVDWDDFLFMS